MSNEIFTGNLRDVAGWPQSPLPWLGGAEVLSKPVLAVFWGRNRPFSRHAAELSTAGLLLSAEPQPPHEC